MKPMSAVFPRRNLQNLQQTFSGREPLPQPSRTGRMMNPQMMEAAQKMMAKMSPEDMERMMQVCVCASAATR